MYHDLEKMVSLPMFRRAGERVVILLNDVWNCAVVDFGCVRFIILWFKLKLKGDSGVQPQRRRFLRSQIL